MIRHNLLHAAPRPPPRAAATLLGPAAGGLGEPALDHDQKKRWFRMGQKWRTGCEGRISVLKRRHGLNRSRYRGEQGMERWVGLGVVADTLINMGRVLAIRRSG